MGVLRVTAQPPKAAQHSPIAIITANATTVRGGSPGSVAHSSPIRPLPASPVSASATYPILLRGDNGASSRLIRSSGVMPRTPSAPTRGATTSSPG